MKQSTTGTTAPVVALAEALKILNTRTLSILVVRWMVMRLVMRKGKVAKCF